MLTTEDYGVYGSEGQLSRTTKQDLDYVTLPQAAVTI